MNKNTPYHDRPFITFCTPSGALLALSSDLTLPLFPPSSAANGHYNPQVVNAFAECFRGVDILNHPPIFWALLPKTVPNNTVQASVFVLYIRYYHIYLSLLITQRLPNRLLSDDDLLFLVAIAALGTPRPLSGASLKLLPLD